MEPSDEQLNQLRLTLIDNYAKTKNFDMLNKCFEGSFQVNSPKVRGKLAEIRLEILLRQYSYSRNNTIFIGNLVVSGHTTTEIDLALITKSKFVLFEVKSYNGAKTLSDKCLLKTKHASTDVAKQSVFHLDMAEEVFGTYRNPKSELPFKLIFYSYAKGSISDIRTTQWKERIPYLTDKNLFDELDRIVESGDENCWDLKRAIPHLRKLEESGEELFKAHVKRLQSSRS